MQELVGETKEKIVDTIENNEKDEKEQIDPEESKNPANKNIEMI